MTRVYVPPLPNELQIDLDAVTLTEFYRRLNVLRGIDLVKIVEVIKVPSKTAEHWHVTVKLDQELQEIERIALQACLGSDPMRELLNWARVRQEDEVPMCFIEPVERKRRQLIEYDDVADVEEEVDTDFYGEEPYPDRPMLECDHDVRFGRCDHMDEFQVPLKFAYGGVK